MSILHGRETKRFVLPRIFRIAHPDEGALEQLHDRAQDLFARQAGQGQIATHTLTNLWKLLGKTGHAIVLRLVADFSPPFVVEVLFAPPRVPTGCLNMAVARWTDPDIGPGRRNGEPFDAQQTLLIANSFSLQIEVRSEEHTSELQSHSDL